MYTLDDTIVAISTPIGEGGIGIVRLSGPDVAGIARRLFVAADASAQELEPNHLTYGRIVHPNDGRIVDEVLLSYMRAPRTYTRQDVVEINAHGGIVPQREILALCLEAGAREAHPGEFTLRAFMNGRIDLAQAEAVRDVISAKTGAALRVAIDQLGGHLSDNVRRIRRELLTCLAYLEATIDFPSDEIPSHDVGPGLVRAEGQLVSLLREADRGMVYRQGIHTAIVGRPNVGKSSLLNRLLRTDRAIVTPIAGTTRDTLEETANLSGIPLVLVDTAGIKASDDVVERLGIERSRAMLARADLVLMVVDGSVSPSVRDVEVAALIENRPAILVVNKSDLPSAGDYASVLDAPCVRLSALTGQGIADLETTLVETVLAGGVTSGDTAPLASNPRHRDLFRRALEHVREAIAALDRGDYDDMAAIDVAEAVAALGEVTGEMASEDLLDTIFGSFCIGK